MKLFQKSESEEVLQLAWLDRQDALVRIKRGLAGVEIFEEMNGRRVRRCEGAGMTVLSAIQDARKILREQGATD
jgi:hypothetical protein